MKKDTFMTKSQNLEVIEMPHINYKLQAGDDELLLETIHDIEGFMTDEQVEKLYERLGYYVSDLPDADFPAPDEIADKLREINIELVNPIWFEQWVSKMGAIHDDWGNIKISITTSDNKTYTFNETMSPTAINTIFSNLYKLPMENDIVFLDPETKQPMNINKAPDEILKHLIPYSTVLAATFFASQDDIRYIADAIVSSDLYREFDRLVNFLTAYTIIKEGHKQFFENPSLKTLQELMEALQFSLEDNAGYDFIQTEKLTNILKRAVENKLTNIYRYTAGDSSPKASEFDASKYGVSPLEKAGYRELHSGLKKQYYGILKRDKYAVALIIPQKIKSYALSEIPGDVIAIAPSHFVVFDWEESYGYAQFSGSSTANGDILYDDGKNVDEGLWGTYKVRFRLPNKSAELGEVSVDYTTYVASVNSFHDFIDEITPNSKTVSDMAKNASAIVIAGPLSIDEINKALKREFSISLSELSNAQLYYLPLVKEVYKPIPIDEFINMLEDKQEKKQFKEWVEELKKAIKTKSSGHQNKLGVEKPKRGPQLK